MAEISKITLPSGTTYDIKDTVAREMASGVIHLVPGENTTPLVDGASTNPITIDGESYTAVSGDAVFYESKEYVYDGSIWHEFGDLTGLKALAYKDTASTSYTPSGNVSTPVLTGTQITLELTGTPEGTVSQPSFTGDSLTSTGTFTPVGSVSTPTITVATAGATTIVNSITDVGTLPTLSTTVENENLTISFNQGTLPTRGNDTTVKTGDASYESSQPVFTGTEGNLNVSGTPTGTVSQPTFTGEVMTASGDYTPEGTISTPIFSGTTTTITVS